MRAYSFQNTVVYINGVEITGWAEGDDVISIKRSADSASHKVGADGNMMISISADKSGEFSFKLQQTSSSNKFLLDLVSRMEGGAQTFVPVDVLFQDNFRNDLGTGKGYIKKPTDVTRGAQGNGADWTVVVEKLDLLLGDPAMIGSGAVGGVAGVFG
ncbi:MAG: DUF3277 family protein [Betaproteobacteria bacterium]|nr:DUF3277 family protein [Betaproteobacteria bacterium]